MKKTDSSVSMANHRVRLTYMLKLLGVAALYALLAKIVLTFFSANGVVSIVWPPSGLALAMLLIGGRRYFPGVFLGAFLANAMTGLALGVAAAIAIGNTLEALLGVWLLTRNGRFDSNLRALGDYLRLIVLGGFFACVVAALNGATVLLLSGFLSAGAYFPNLVNWWMGDVLGVTLVAPLMLVWRRMPGGWLGAKGVVEAALVFGLTLLAGQIVFLGWFYDTVGQVALGYWMFLFVAWAAVRLGIHGVVTVLSMVAIQGMLGAAQGVGFFAQDIAKTGLTTYWCYMMVLSVVGMALATYFTERKRIEEALRESEENLNRAQAVGQIGSWLLDIRTNRLEWSAETYRMFGLPQREAVDLETFVAAIHPDDRDFVLRAWGEAVAGTPYDIEHRIVVDGQVRWVRERARIERNAKGRPLTGIGTVQDVTELKRIEAALSESEERYRALFEQGAEPVWLVDAQTGTFVDFNTAAHESLGYTREEFTRLNIADLEAAESPQEVALHMEKVNTEGYDVFETIHRTKRGELRNILVSVKTITFGGKTYLQSIQRDITGRKQAEEKLRVSEQKFMRLFMEIPIPLGFADKEGVIAHFNNKFTEVFGYTVGDVPTLDEWWLKAYPEETYRRWVLDNWKDAAAKAAKEGTNIESAEYRVTGKNGAERMVIIGGSPVEGGILAIFNDITERKRAEEELRFKAQLLDSVSDSIFVHENGNFVYLNEAAWKTRGYTREELMGMNLHDLDTPEYAALLELRRKEMTEKGQIIFESAHRLKDGSVMPIEVTARIGEFGGRKLILGVARDITERKNTGKKLAATFKELESIIRVNPDILYVINPEGELIKWNPTLEKLCGLTPEQMMNRPAVEFVCEEDRPTVIRGIAEVFEKGSASIEVRFIRNDGALVTHLCNGAVWKNPDGEVMGFVGVGKDITERKQAERVLRESESRFRSLVETTSDWIWEVDENIVFTYASPKIHDILGYAAAEIIGKTPFDFMVPEEAKRVAGIAGTIAAMREPFTNLENTSLHKDGHPVVIETSGVPVIGPEGKFCGYRGINRDITERKEFEEELKRSNVDLEQFSYAVSHDMRQPLRMISSYLQLLERSLAGQLDNEKRGYFDSAIEGAKRIDQMLVALLEYSRIGRMGEPPTLIDSRATLGEVLQFLQPAIAEAQAKLSIAGEWPRIFASPDEILRLLQNLVGNAIKYRIAGRTPEIIVTSEMVKNEWHLCVADNGVGIIPDQIKQLFQVFRRLQSREAYEGTGIGLALCRKIAEHHKGRIWAESAGEGRGSKFYVVLPVLQMQILSQ